MSIKRTITIVTGNAGKARELEELSAGKFKFVRHDLDIAEIQSLDLEEIIKDKARKAFEAVKAPVIVDDVSVGLDSLKGLPGPFIKFYFVVLGRDALKQMQASKNDMITVTCVAAYYDGSQYMISRGEFRGTVVEARGDNGFGFDPVIIIEGQEMTMAEMSEKQKFQVSHRGKAFRDLVAKLEKLK